MGFLGISMQSQKVGTWSTSSLIPRREDIIPRWSQLLTPLFDQGERNHGGEKNNVFRALWSKDIVYE